MSFIYTIEAAIGSIRFIYVSAATVSTASRLSVTRRRQLPLTVLHPYTEQLRQQHHVCSGKHCVDFILHFVELADFIKRHRPSTPLPPPAVSVEVSLCFRLT